MRLSNVLAGAALFLVASLVLADPVQDLFKQSGCLACHSIDKQAIGPSYAEVAAKYRGDPFAATKLAEKIKKGGAGAWGKVPMPPHPALSEADLKTMVNYILALKK